MNISGDDFVPKTADKVPLKRGMIVYKIYLGPACGIEKYRVWYWNNGRRANPDLLKPKKERFHDKDDPYYYDLRHRGGAGFYGKNEDNAYAYIPIKDCYADLEKAKRRVCRDLNKKIREGKAIQDEYLNTKNKAYI